MNITEIFEGKNVLPYLEERNLVQQYAKAKKYMLAGHLKTVGFKLRQPKERGIYSFRVNKQFRALCVYKEGELRVFKIDNHQN